ncbi:MAG: TIGR00730 family Rossman fold protein [Christensenellaceae bacterium]|nr:TIGR00730 family Rossman fold protein [Christensenellaceae bacterium]
MDSSIKRICVYGAGSSTLDRDFFDAAYELGALAAKRGIGVVFGGGNSGIMGYLAKGTADNGGELIGVAPEFMKPRNVLYSRCTELIYTEDMRERKRVMEELSDAFVVMPGGFGTMEEFFEVLTAKTLGLHMKPIALVNTKGVWDELETFSKRLLSEGFISESCIGSYRICPDPAGALDFVMNDPDKDKEPKWVKYVVKEEDILK